MPSRIFDLTITGYEHDRIGSVKVMFSFEQMTGHCDCIKGDGGLEVGRVIVYDGNSHYDLVCRDIVRYFFCKDILDFAEKVFSDSPSPTQEESYLIHADISKFTIQFTTINRVKVYCGGLKPILSFYRNESCTPWSVGDQDFRLRLGWLPCAAGLIKKLTEEIDKKLSDKKNPPDAPFACLEHLLLKIKRGEVLIGENDGSDGVNVLIGDWQLIVSIDPKNKAIRSVKEVGAFFYQGLDSLSDLEEWLVIRALQPFFSNSISTNIVF